MKKEMNTMKIKNNFQAFRFYKNLNKKADTSVNFIIAVILGITVLVIAIYMIYNYTNTGSWFGIAGGKDNVAAVVKSCQLDCSSASSYNYCTKERKVTFADSTHKNGDFTCLALEVQAIGLEKCTNLDCTKLG